MDRLHWNVGWRKMQVRSSEKNTVFCTTRWPSDMVPSKKHLTWYSLSFFHLNATLCLCGRGMKFFFQANSSVRFQCISVVHFREEFRCNGNHRSLPSTWCSSGFFSQVIQAPMVVSHFCWTAFWYSQVCSTQRLQKEPCSWPSIFYCKKSRFTLHRSGTKSRTTTGQCGSTQSWDFPQYVQWVQFCCVVPLVCEQLVWSFRATAMHHRIMGVVRVQFLCGSSCSLVAVVAWNKNKRPGAEVQAEWCLQKPEARLC